MSLSYSGPGYSYTYETTYSSNAQTCLTGQLVIVAFERYANIAAGTCTISNSGTAQTWSLVAETDTANNSKVAVWQCVMSADVTNMVVTVDGHSTNDHGIIFLYVHSGQHASNPIPSGNVYFGTEGSNVTQSITPSSVGSLLWFFASDWQGVATALGAASGCTVDDFYFILSTVNFTAIRPTTEPLASTSPFTIGETDPGAKVAWIAFEVQAAADYTLDQYGFRWRNDDGSESAATWVAAQNVAP